MRSRRRRADLGLRISVVIEGMGAVREDLLVLVTQSWCYFSRSQTQFRASFQDSDSARAIYRGLRQFRIYLSRSRTQFRGFLSMCQTKSTCVLTISPDTTTSSRFSPMFHQKHRIRAWLKMRSGADVLINFYWLKRSRGQLFTFPIRYAVPFNSFFQYIIIRVRQAKLCLMF